MSTYTVYGLFSRDLNQHHGYYTFSAAKSCLSRTYIARDLSYSLTTWAVIKDITLCSSTTISNINHSPKSIHVLTERTNMSRIPASELEPQPPSSPASSASTHEDLHSTPLLPSPLRSHPTSPCSSFYSTTNPLLPTNATTFPPVQNHHDHHNPQPPRAHAPPSHHLRAGSTTASAQNLASPSPRPPSWGTRSATRIC